MGACISTASPRGARRDRHDRSCRAACRRDDRLCSDPRGQLLPSAQRHHAVAAVGDLSDAEGRLRARLLADRPADPDLPGDGLAAAAADRHLHRQAAAALFAARRHGLDAGRAAPPRLRRSTTRMLLLGAALVGIGSAVFHPESSRVARLASGGRYGLAQSLFQVGGNFGTALGPLLAAFIVVPRGQGSVAWFSVAALVGMVVLWQVGTWYSNHRKVNAAKAGAGRVADRLPRRRDRHRAGRAGAAGLHQERLHGQPLQLLHLLRDREVRRDGAGIRRSCCSCSSARRRSARSSAGRSATASAPRR